MRRLGQFAVTSAAIVFTGAILVSSGFRDWLGISGEVPHWMRILEIFGQLGIAAVAASLFIEQNFIFKRQNEIFEKQTELMREQSEYTRLSIKQLTEQLKKERDQENKAYVNEVMDRLKGLDPNISGFAPSNNGAILVQILESGVPVHILVCAMRDFYLIRLRQRPATFKPWAMICLVKAIEGHEAFNARYSELSGYVEAAAAHPSGLIEPALDPVEAS